MLWSLARGRFALYLCAYRVNTSDSHCFDAVFYFKSLQETNAHARLGETIKRSIRRMCFQMFACSVQSSLFKVTTVRTKKLQFVSLRQVIAFATHSHTHIYTLIVVHRQTLYIIHTHTIYTHTHTPHIYIHSLAHTLTCPHTHLYTYMYRHNIYIHTLTHTWEVL